MSWNNQHQRDVLSCRADVKSQRSQSSCVVHTSENIIQICLLFLLLLHWKHASSLRLKKLLLTPTRHFYSSLFLTGRHRAASETSTSRLVWQSAVFWETHSGDQLYRSSWYQHHLWYYKNHASDFSEDQLSTQGETPKWVNNLIPDAYHRRSRSLLLTKNNW